LLDASREFERRVGEVAAPRGEKSALVKEAIVRAAGRFTVSDLQKQCPGVSVDMIRYVLKQLRDSGDVECLGRGRTAVWQRRSDSIG